MRKLLAIGFAIGLVWGLTYSFLPAPHLAPRHWSFGATAALAGHPPPTFSATIACSPDPSTAPILVTCTETPSNCPAGEDFISDINFGDGSGWQTNSSPSASHTYSSAGGYTVQSTVACIPAYNYSVNPTTTESLH